MAFGIIHFFAGGTKKQYDATLAAVHPAKGLPKGQLFHTAGASAGGYTIIAVHESRESWEAFRDNVLRPKLTAGIDGGFTAQPQETAFEIDNLQGLSMTPPTPRPEERKHVS